MKVLVLGASGIIGQHLRLDIPPGVEAVFCRRKPDLAHEGFDLADAVTIKDRLAAHKPDVIINLAGENNTDAVERDPDAARPINVDAVKEIAEYCRTSGARLIQISTQAVFDGEHPPYGPDSECHPINEYGRQKRAAEIIALNAGGIVIRPTFVLGVRPMPHVGRVNPVEQVWEGQQKQVADRWFSVLFASDAAQQIWRIVTEPTTETIIHLGIPHTMNRHGVAFALHSCPGWYGGQATPVAVPHSDFAGLAPRPINTTYGESTRWKTNLNTGFMGCVAALISRANCDLRARAREISIFTGATESECYGRLALGFSRNHEEVAHDFRCAAPKTDDELLRWYRETESYIWELSAYHCDPGFNYSGMCAGVAERLNASGARRVLCLGDGIGDLTLALRRAGLDAVYHDLEDSRTAAFAAFRYWVQTGETLPMHNTAGWAPQIMNGRGGYDAVVSFDYLEHVTDVPAWAAAIRDALVPGGLLMAQNAFAMGSGENGSIPMHLSRNDRFEKDWDPMLAGLGMRQLSSNWYQKA